MKLKATITIEASMVIPLIILTIASFIILAFNVSRNTINYAANYKSNIEKDINEFSEIDNDILYYHSLYITIKNINDNTEQD